MKFVKYVKELIQMIYQNTDIPKINKALDRYTKICKQIGSIDYQIEYSLSKYCLEPGNSKLEEHILELKQYRTVLENQKFQAEDKIYKAFDEQYS